MGQVPNTTTFSLQDVTLAIYGDTAAGRNLSQCFTDATGVFDSNYVGSKNSLYNFRNYNHNPVTTVTFYVYYAYRGNTHDSVTVFVNGTASSTYRTTGTFTNTVNSSDSVYIQVTSFSDFGYINSNIDGFEAFSDSGTVSSQEYVASNIAGKTFNAYSSTPNLP